MKGHDLIFFWNSRDRRLIVLFFSVIIAIIFHFIGLSIFRVVSPKVKRFTIDERKVYIQPNKFNNFDSEDSSFRVSKINYEQVSFDSEPFYSNFYNNLNEGLSENLDSANKSDDFKFKPILYEPSFYDFKDIKEPIKEKGIDTILDDLMLDYMIPKFISNDNLVVSKPTVNKNKYDEEESLKLSNLDINLKGRIVINLPVINFSLLKLARESGLILDIGVDKDGNVLVCLFDNILLEGNSLYLLSKNIKNELKFNSINKDVSDYEINSKSNINNNKVSRDNMTWGRVIF